MRRPPFALLCLLLGAAAAPALAQPGYPGAPTFPGAGAPPPGGYTDPAYAWTQASVSPPTLGSDASYYAAPPTGYDPPSSTSAAFHNTQTGIGSSLLSYNYVEATYRYLDPRGNALDGNHGLGIDLSVALLQPFFLKASLIWGSGTGGNTVAGAVNADYAFSAIQVGGGAYMPITQQLHFIGEVGLIYANLDADRLGLSYTEGGVFVRPALRYQAFDNLELQAGVTVTSADDFDSRLLDFAAYLRVLPQLDVSAGAALGDENRTMKLGARLRW